MSADPITLELTNPQAILRDSKCTIGYRKLESEFELG